MKKLFTALFILIASPAFAEPNVAEIKRIENYLNSITTLVSDFIQTAPDGGVSSGRFFLSRPGKLRWQYDPPVPILLVANGGVMAYYDFELDTVSHVSTNSNIAGLLARKIINLNDEDITVKDLKQAAGSIRLIVTKKGEEDEGTFTFIFNSSPLTLKKLEVVDATKQKTSITLNNPKYGEKLDDKMFVVDKEGRLPKKKN